MSEDSQQYSSSSQDKNELNYKDLQKQIQTLSPSYPTYKPKKINPQQTLPSESKAYTEAMKALQEKIKNLQKQNEDLREQASQQEQRQQKKIDMQEQIYEQQIQDLSEKHEQYQEFIVQLEQQIKSSQRTLEDIQNEIKMKDKKIRQQQEEIQQLTQQIEEEKKSYLVQYEEMLENLEYERLQKQEIQDAFQQIQLDKQELVQELDQQQNQMKSLSESIYQQGQKVQNELLKDKQKCEVQEQEIEELQKIIKEIENQRDYYIKMYDQEVETNQEIKAKFQQAEIALQQKNQEILASEESRKILAHQNERAQQLMRDVVAVNEKLVKTLKQQHKTKQDENLSQTQQIFLQSNQNLKQDSGMKYRSQNLQEEQSRTDSVWEQIQQIQADLEQKNEQYKLVLQKAQEASNAEEMGILRQRLVELAQYIHSESDKLFKLKRNLHLSSSQSQHN